MALSFLQAASNTTTQTAFTFSAQNLGAASADRYIIVGTAGRKAGTSGTISSITIGGVTATIIRQRSNTSGGTNNTGALAIALVPTGTTGDIVITFSEAFLRCGIALWAVTEMPTATQVDEDSAAITNPSLSLDVPTGGFALAYGFTGATANASWTGLTEAFDTNFQTNASHTGASLSFTTAEAGRTIEITFSANTESLLIAASFRFGVRKITGVSRLSVKKVLSKTFANVKKILGYAP